MKMPSRSEFTDGSEFLTALNGWMAASDLAYQHLRGLFDVTPPVTEKPDWIERAANVRNVAMLSAPGAEDMEPALRNLSASAMNGGFEIARICHGSFHDAGNNGNPYWAVFAELRHP